MKENRTGRFLLNILQMTALVFYALALTLVIGSIQLVTWLIMKLSKRCRLHAGGGRICMQK